MAGSCTCDCAIEHNGWSASLTSKRFASSKFPAANESHANDSNGYAWNAVRIPLGTDEVQMIATTIRFYGSLREASMFESALCKENQLRSGFELKVRCEHL